MNPSVGRIVHYLRERETGRCLAALVVGVDMSDPDEGVELRVFVPGGVDVNVHCATRPVDGHHGFWHWPERV